MLPRDLSPLYPYCSGTRVWRLGGFQLSAAPANLCLPQPCSPGSTAEGEGGWSPHQWWHLGHFCPAEMCSWQLCLFQGGFFYFFTWYKRRRLTAMTHSLFPRLLRQSCFSQLQSQVILNNSPAALAHTNVIRSLASLTILLHTAFQTVNSFLPLEPPLPIAPGAWDVYSSKGIHHCAPVATTALVFTLSPTTDNRHPGRFEQDQLHCHPACYFEVWWRFRPWWRSTMVTAGTGHWAVCSRQLAVGKAGSWEHSN